MATTTSMETATSSTRLAHAVQTLTSSGGSLIEEGGYNIPVFTNKLAERTWAKEQMAGAFRVLAKLGFNDGAGGHISLRDPIQTDCFWISKLSSPSFTKLCS